MENAAKTIEALIPSFLPFIRVTPLLGTLKGDSSNTCFTCKHKNFI